MKGKTITTKFVKQLTATIVAAAMATSMAVSVSAVSWDAIHVNQPGAPTSASTEAQVTVYHRAAGAKATCTSVSHTNSSGLTGYTRIYCDNYTLSPSPISITNTDVAICVPMVGSPTTDIAVEYTIVAYTPYSNDTFRTKGNIVKYNG